MNPRGYIYSINSDNITYSYYLNIEVSRNINWWMILFCERFSDVKRCFRCLCDQEVGL